MNPLRLSDKDEKSLEKAMTTRELAEVLGVDVKTIQRAVDSLDIDVERVGSSHTMVFNEAQATAIKLELQNHSKIAQNGFNTLTINNDVEMLLLQKRLTEYQDRRIAELTQIVEEQRPKALVYDRICNADGLKSVEQVASNLGWGKNNFFALMRGMGIFFYSSKDADGRKVNLPKREYVERGYFVTKEEPYTRGDKDRLYTKIYVTGKGEAWLANRLNEVVEDSAAEIEKQLKRNF